MAATITFNGSTISNADSTTGWTALKIAGTGGGPSAAAADGQLEGTGAVTTVVSKQHVVLYFDIGSGNELDFTGGGAEENQLIYIWANFLAPALLNTQSAGGFGVFLESSTPTTTQYHEWYFDGSDTYDGGWKQFILDPNETVSASAGTAINLASVRYIGLFADVGATTLRFDNLIADLMQVGTGLTITGTSTTDALVADIVADEATNRYGIVKSLNSPDSAVELAGKLVLGDVTAATASTLTDVSAKIFLAEPTYYDGTSVTTSVPTGFFDISCVGGTGTNSIIIGKAVGTDSGRSGWTIVGNSSYNLSIDFDNGSVNTSEWYGCNFEDITGTLSWGTASAHKCFSNNFSGCEQFNPVGAIQIRNCNFSTVYDDGTADASNRSALLWNSSIDIESCNFLANSHASSDVAHGIEHDTIVGAATGTVTTADATGVTLTDSAASFLTTAAISDIVFNETDGSTGIVSSVDSNTQLTCSALTGGTDNQFDTPDAYSVVTPVTYTDLVFSGNEKDVHNSTTDGLAISKTGTSNPSTNTGTVFFQGSVTLTFKAVDSANAPIENVRVSAFLVSTDTEVVNALTNASGEVTASFAGTTPSDVYYRFRKSSTGATKYVNLSGVDTIASGTGLSVTRSMREDTTADPDI